MIKTGERIIATGGEHIVVCNGKQHYVIVEGARRSDGPCPERRTVVAKVHGIYNRIHTLCHRQLATVAADQVTERREDMTCVPCKDRAFNLMHGYRPRWVVRSNAHGETR